MSFINCEHIRQTENLNVEPVAVAINLGLCTSLLLCPACHAQLKLAILEGYAAEFSEKLVKEISKTVASNLPGGAA